MFGKTVAKEKITGDASHSNNNSSCADSTSVVVTNINDNKLLVPPQTILTEDLSESSSEIENEDENSQEPHGGYTHPLFESDDDPTEPRNIDPYADVRDKMERLARADREKNFSLKGNQTHEADDDLIIFNAFSTFLSYAIVIVLGNIRDLFAMIFGRSRFNVSNKYPSDDKSRYAPLLTGWEVFYTKRLYLRLSDCFNKPVGSNPGSFINVLERVSEDGHKSFQQLGSKPKSNEKEELQGTINKGSQISHLDKDTLEKEYLNGKFVTETEGKIARRCLNLGSYNYLGFGDDWNDTCARSVLPTLEDLPVSCNSSRIESGNTIYHEELESLMAEFLGQESALVHNMGFSTNSTTIPALVGKGDLIVSDELNHTSIVNGARSSGANIRIFRHNDAKSLEDILIEAIVMGRPRTRRPFKRILVIVEGIYSMEGEYCNLGPISKVCKKYGAYLYLDEAHSIGAMGPTGRGCCEYWGIKGVDIMMGTFSKSFGGMGGYVAGKKEVIDSLRLTCSGNIFHNSLSPIVCNQILTALKVGLFTNWYAFDIFNDEINIFFQTTDNYG